MTLTRLAWPTIHLSSGHFLGRQRTDSYHIQGRQQAHTHTHSPDTGGVVTPGATEVQGLGWKARDSEAARSCPSVLRSALRCPHPSCNLECRAPPLPSRDPRAPLLRPGALRDLRLLRRLPAEVGLVKGFCFETVFCAAARSRSAASLPSPRPPTLLRRQALVSRSYLR